MTLQTYPLLDSHALFACDPAYVLHVRFHCIGIWLGSPREQLSPVLLLLFLQHCDEHARLRHSTATGPCRLALMLGQAMLHVNLRHDVDVDGTNSLPFPKPGHEPAWLLEQQLRTTAEWNWRQRTSACRCLDQQALCTPSNGHHTVCTHTGSMRPPRCRHLHHRVLMAVLDPSRWVLPGPSHLLQPSPSPLGHT
jgi:hypothetical protein